MLVKRWLLFEETPPLQGAAGTVGPCYDSMGSAAGVQAWKGGDATAGVEQPGSGIESGVPRFLRMLSKLSARYLFREPLCPCLWRSTTVKTVPSVRHLCQGHRGPSVEQSRGG